MNINQSSYRSIMKATSIFGGVQVFVIIISIVKAKFVALLIGSAGMGVLGLLNSSLALISGITNCGLGTSAVREVSFANSNGNQKRIALVINVLRNWVWITGAAGAILIICLSSFLSEVTFGNSNYVWSFTLISITLFFNQLNIGHVAQLQGLQKIQYLAKSTLFGSIIGLVVTIPLYYLYKEEGIVPSLILSSISSYAISKYFTSKIKIETIWISRKRILLEGKNMVKMGFMISLSGVFLTCATYVLQLFINKEGGIEQVGLFTAGFAIINSYVGLIFNALGTDYYPRLSAIADSKELTKNLINQQAEISVLILGPIIIVFIVFIKLIIVILYSSKFLGIENMVIWLGLATFFKAASWAIAFLFLAKGKSKLFFWNEMLAIFYILFFNLTGYYYWGLTGLGASCFASYIVYLVQVYAICNIKYQFSFDNSFIKIFVVQLSLALLCFTILKFIANPFASVLGMLIALLSLWYSYVELDKRIGLKLLISNFLNKK